MTLDVVGPASARSGTGRCLTLTLSPWSQRGRRACLSIRHLKKLDKRLAQNGGDGLESFDRDVFAAPLDAADIGGLQAGLKAEAFL